MAAINVLAGSLDYNDLYYAVATTSGTGTATTLAFGWTTPFGFSGLRGTGTNLVFTNGDLTGGVITSLSYYGVEGTLLWTMTGLSFNAASFQAAADAGNTGSEGQFRTLISPLVWSGTGNSSSDVMYGGAGVDRFNGGWGNDVFVGMAGADIFNGGFLRGSTVAVDESGDDYDTVSYRPEGGSQGIVVDMRLTSGNVIDTYGSADTLANIELIMGSNLADTYRGSDLAIYEAFTGNNGADTMDGGGGLMDELRYDRENGTSGVTVNLATHVATDSYGATDSITNFERIRGTAYNDTLTGDAGANTLRGNAGADVLDGGDGVDTVVYSHDWETKDASGDWGNYAIRVDLQLGIARDGFSVFDTLVSIENVDATPFNDRVLGSAANNEFILGSGADYADGRGGNDRIEGGDGNDVLFGGLGMDRLDGGAAADTLYGGYGVDTLIGGVGYDRFVFNTPLASNVDTITDFVAADDTIVLENAVFTAFPTVGFIAASAFVVGTAATTADQRIIYDSATGALFYDADGSGTASTAVQFATLSTKPTITAADFQVI